MLCLCSYKPVSPKGPQVSCFLKRIHNAEFSWTCIPFQCYVIVSTPSSEWNLLPKPCVSLLLQTGMVV